MLAPYNALMVSNARNSFDDGESETVGSLNYANDGGNMGKEDRKVLVLRLLAESELALTPYVLFRNLRMREATFERRTLSYYLAELLEEGRVERLEPNGDPLYQITEKGRSSVREHEFY